MPSDVRPTLDGFYRSLRERDFGQQLPPFEALPRPSILDDPTLAHQPYVVFVVDFRTQAILFMSDSSADVLGWPPSYFLSGGITGALGLTHPDDQPGVAQIAHDYIIARQGLTRAQLEAHHWTLTRRLRRPDGSYLWYLTQYVPLHLTDADRVLYALGTGFDITLYARLTQPVGALVYPSDEGGRTTVTLPLATSAHEPLSPRELDVLRLVAQGLTSAQIGERLYISKSTVDTHRRNILSKTGLSNSVEMTNLALSMGLV